MLAALSIFTALIAGGLAASEQSRRETATFTVSAMIVQTSSGIGRDARETLQLSCNTQRVVMVRQAARRQDLSTAVAHLHVCPPAADQQIPLDGSTTHVALEF